MRKPLDTALKQYEERKKLDEQRDPTFDEIMKKEKQGITTKQRFKVITITILHCMNLKRDGLTYNPTDMLPFYYYEFYTFDFKSPNSRGENPAFNIQKTYEVENTSEFRQYLER